MTPSEQHRLTVELVVWIADQVRRLGAFTPTSSGPVLDSATTPFVSACYALWSVGVAVTTDASGGPPEDRGYGTPPPHFRFFDEADIRLALADHKVTPKNFSGLIGNFAELRAHAPDAFELTAEWFRPSLTPPLLEAFVAAGFLERSGERYRWTDVMAQWIEWSAPRHAWESREESAARHLNKYGAIWKTMPPWIRQKVINGRYLNKMMLVDAIRRFWDGQWRNEQLPDWDDQKRLIDAMGSADHIQRLLESGKLRLYWLYPFSRLFKWFGGDR